MGKKVRPSTVLLLKKRGVSLHSRVVEQVRGVVSGGSGLLLEEHELGAPVLDCLRACVLCGARVRALTLLVKEAPAGREMARSDIRALLDVLMDMVVQCARNATGRRVCCRCGGRG